MTVVSTLVTYSNPKAQYKHVNFLKRDRRCQQCKAMILSRCYPAVVNYKTGEVFHESCFKVWWRAYEEELTATSASHEEELLNQFAKAIFERDHPNPNLLSWQDSPARRIQYRELAQFCLGFLRERGAIIP